MKTLLTFLLLGCLALQAQNPPTNTATAAAADRQEKLLRALRERMATLDPSSAATNAPPGAGFPGAASAAPTGVRPPATNLVAPLPLAQVPSTNLPLASVSTPIGTNSTRIPSPVFPGPPGAPPLSQPALPTAATRPLPVPGMPAVGPGAPGRPPAFPGVPGTVQAAGVAAAEQARLAKMTAGTPPNPDDVATNIFNFPAVDLNTFLNDFYAPIVGRTILRPATLPNITVTLRTVTPLTRKEAIQAFDTVLAMNQITTIPVGEKFVKVVPTQQALQEAAPFSELSATNLPETAQYVTYIVQLKYVKPSEVAAVLQPLAKVPNAVLPIESSQMLVIRDFSENVKRMLEVIAKVDVSVPSEFISLVIPIKYALADDIANALSSLGTGGASTTVGKSSSAGRTGGGRSMGFGGGMGTPGGMGTGYGGMGMGGYGTGYGATPGVPGMQPYGSTTPLGEVTPMATAAMPGTVPGQPSFSDRLRSIIQRASGTGTDKIEILGPNKIIADDRTNSLLIFATRQDMKMITNIVAQLDVVLAQVIIEALIMEVSVGDKLNYGVSWLQQPQTSGKFSQTSAIQNDPTLHDPGSLVGSGTNGLAGAFPSGFSWFGKYGNSFDVAVQAAASDNRVHVLSRPRIQTSHAVPATITIGTSQPIVTGTYSYYGGPQTQFAYQNFGIELDVLPLINPDGLVVMDIQQQIQSINGYVNVGQGLTEPILANRSANAKVAVKSGETVMLGGFISSNTSNTRSGVPILKDIPLLGALFSSASKSHDRTELIVLIRPTVLPTPEVAAIAAKEAQDRMPLVKRAAQDEQAYRDEVLRKLEKEDKRSSRNN